MYRQCLLQGQYLRRLWSAPASNELICSHGARDDYLLRQITRVGVEGSGCVGVDEDVCVGVGVVVGVVVGGGCAVRAVIGGEVNVVA
jgi:hypothetical protein